MLRYAQELRSVYSSFRIDFVSSLMVAVLASAIHPREGAETGLATSPPHSWWIEIASVRVTGKLRQAGVVRSGCQG